MTTIKNITNLDELVVFDKIIRKYTLGITNCSSTADDITQDMYIKVHKAMEKGKIIDGGYIVITLKHLFLDNIKNENKKDKGTSTCEAFIPDQYDDSDENIEEKNEIERRYNILIERINNLNWYEQSLLKLMGTNSLLSISRSTHISYDSLIHSKKKINKKLGIIKPKK